MKKTGHGNTADIYNYGGGKVLKLYKKGMPYSACNNEFAVMQCVYEKSRVCPRPYEVIKCEGRMGIVMEMVDGIDYLTLFLKKPWMYKKIFVSMIMLQRQVHTQVHEKMPDVKEKMVTMISELAKNQVLEYEIVYKILKQIEDLPDGTSLCHGDYHPGNIIVGDEKTVVIDWMTAVKGCALYDVAKTVFMIQYNEIYVKGKVLFRLLESVRVYLGKVYLNEYLRIENVKRADFEKWVIPVAASMLAEPISLYEKRKLKKIIKDWFKNN